ncbi:membrane protein PM19L-like [Amaranthus tricolor]|uniref:membrane protein PM19L-like n=1 Tax=Amaranthus tricolor TaxID=29722 RepID=UPI00258C2CE6|nr:membrane protein PM19L-like [Amaranthus tricolor]
MAQGKVGRVLMLPVLVVDLVVYLIILGLASWSLNKYIDGQQNNPLLGGNAATSYMLIFALLAGTTGIASVLAGFAHYRAWSTASMAASASVAAISWALTGLAFGLAWKEVRLGGHRGKRLTTLEVFIIISALIHLLYIMLLHAGSFNHIYGPYYTQHGHEGPISEAQKASSSETHANA